MTSGITRPRVWDAFLTDLDRAHLAQSKPAPRALGTRPALLLVDLYRWVFGDEPQSLLDGVRNWPAHCGMAGWQSLPHIQRLLAQARSLGIPVIHITGLADVPVWGDEAPSRGNEDPAARARRQRRFDIIDEVAPQAGEIVLRKAAPSAFWGTPLAGLLNAAGIDTVVVAGESTSGCVRATVVEAKSYRFKVMVPEECVFDRHEATHALNLFDMDQKYANVVAVDEAIDFFRRCSNNDG
jgi:nicotinamidase-related amidase